MSVSLHINLSILFASLGLIFASFLLLFSNKVLQVVLSVFAVAFALLQLFVAVDVIRPLFPRFWLITSLALIVLSLLFLITRTKRSLKAFGVLLFLTSIAQIVVQYIF